VSNRVIGRYLLPTRCAAREFRRPTGDSGALAEKGRCCGKPRSTKVNTNALVLTDELVRIGPRRREHERNLAENNVSQWLLKRFVAAHARQCSYGSDLSATDQVRTASLAELSTGCPGRAYLPGGKLLGR